MLDTHHGSHALRETVNDLTSSSKDLFAPKVSQGTDVKPIMRHRLPK